MTTYIALLNNVRAAANAERENDSRFSADLCWIISEGTENADDVFGANASEDNEDWAETAIRTIGSALCEREVSSYHGSDSQRLRDWFFANGVSF